MKVHLASVSLVDKSELIDEVPFVLESFYGLSETNHTRVIQRIKDKNWDSFLLDSGVFSALTGSLKTDDWDTYLRKYIDFINRYDVDRFFELDLDSIVGYDKVKEYRDTLIEETGKRPIPVWHVSRGIQDYMDTCKNYDYVAIGGIVTKEIIPDQFPLLAKLIRIAHANDAKIHGLGFTNPRYMKKYHFDSVDSTTWLSAKYGVIYRFTGDSIIKVKKHGRTLAGRCSDYHEYNIGEWIKFQRYADSYM